MSKKKPSFPIIKQLREYLTYYGRNTKLPLYYEDVMEYDSSFPLSDKEGKDTLWESVMYPQYLKSEIDRGMTAIYALLKTDGDMSVMDHLFVERIDYCTFGNSNPFRVRIVNKLNDNYDHFYIKKADASRVYGLELEHILSPNRINYLVDGNTLIEEHIPGIPGDQFMLHNMQLPTFNKVRMAKEFVKFNERCFVRLLGDMRSYNYVVDVTPDFEDEQYRIRAIDFDQQSYEGRRTLYLPQFFKENNPIVELGMTFMGVETVKQYQHEERSLMARRLRSAPNMTRKLVECMQEDDISTEEKVDQLKHELATHFKKDEYLKCQNMGDIMAVNLRMIWDYN